MFLIKLKKKKINCLRKALRKYVILEMIKELLLFKQKVLKSNKEEKRFHKLLTQIITLLKCVL